MKLSSRLEEIICWVPSCRCVVDVGTDHALVPIALLSRNVVERAIGIDKSPYPLSQAKVNCHNALLTAKLELQCAEGLQSVSLEADDVVIMAGMGGRTMQMVLQQTDWRGTLVIQPNRDQVDTRIFLHQQGWQCDGESVIVENDQYFWTSRWRYQPSQKSTVSPLQLYFGDQTWLGSRDVFRCWFEREYARIQALPEQAPAREHLSLFAEMQKVLSDPTNLS